MSHPAQVQFCVKVARAYPQFFKDVNVLDIGSLDVNGSNRGLFTRSQYLGVDIGAGKNVDLVAKAGDLDFRDGNFDTVISTECFEHDVEWQKSIRNILRMLRPGGLFLFTCATTGRGEHGTVASSPGDSPFTPGYYRNLTILDLEPLLLELNPRRFAVVDQDLQFHGFKR